ncbi:hypothetical protein QR680_013752 [Steinernema hermaphroditum]|uniref:Fatty-acid and retinol-binding protein 1 n=1 Tax=Steinernema hermaphroditum TaxID=289476 RepID=A0AA39M2S5_9BILA|nr:hypothetical protein QR680_013752 [Steinernema hermaphroditum]
MVSLVVLLLFLISNVDSLQVPSSGQDKELYDALPKVFQDFYSKLNETDLDLLESVSADLKGKSPDQMYKILKPKSENLAKNVRDFAKEFLKEVNKLSTESKDFMKAVFESFTGISESDDDEAEEDFVKMTYSLSEDAREEIIGAFPSMRTLFDEYANVTTESR